MKKGCSYQCKDTNLKAIHNKVGDDVRCISRCSYQCKDTNLKAIHNCRGGEGHA